MRTLRPIIAAALVVLALSLAVTPAAAATKASWRSIEVRLVNGQNDTPGILVYGELAPTAPLPAEVSLAVPSGTTLDWAGEILGGDVAGDPSVQYTTKPGDGYDEILFTLTKSRHGQVEYVANSAVEPDASGKKATIRWVAPADLPSVGLYIETPVGATISNPDAAKVSDVDGAPFYYKVFTGVKKGQTVKLSVGYSGGTWATLSAQTPATQPQQPARAGGSNILLAVAALAAILVMLLFAMQRFSQPVVSEEAEPRQRTASPERRRRRQAAESKPAAKQETAEPADDDDPFSAAS